MPGPAEATGGPGRPATPRHHPFARDGSLPVRRRKPWHALPRRGPPSPRSAQPRRAVLCNRPDRPDRPQDVVVDRLASSAPSCCPSPRTTCTTVLLSLYMQDVLGFTVLRAGLGYLGEGAAAPLGGMYVAKLLGRFGGVKMLSAGCSFRVPARSRCSPCRSTSTLPPCSSLPRSWASATSSASSPSSR